MILPQGLDGTRHLPGRIVLVGAPLLADAKGADGLAEAVLAERLRSEAADPLVAALRWAGLRATFRLLTTGSLPDGALRGYGESLLSQAQPPVDGGILAVRSEEAGLAVHAGAAGASADEAPPPPPRADRQRLGGAAGHLRRIGRLSGQVGVGEAFGPQPQQGGLLTRRIVEGSGQNDGDAKLPMRSRARAAGMPRPASRAAARSAFASRRKAPTCTYPASA